MKEQNIIVVENFQANVQTLWLAITDLEQMHQWFFKNISDFSPEVGFKTEFTLSSGERDFLHQWEIVEVTPPYKIVCKWQYGGYDGISYVTFLLEDEDDKTKLTVTHEGMENFPDEVPEFRKESCKAGWTYFIKDRLSQYAKRLANK